MLLNYLIITSCAFLSIVSSERRFRTSMVLLVKYLMDVLL